MSCLERAIRFVEGGMQVDEVMTFVAHVQDCFECRDFFESVSRYLEARARIWERLDRRGG